MAVDIFAKYATDEKKEVEGVEVDCGNDLVLIIARHGNVAYDSMLLKELEEHREELDSLPEDKRDALSKDIDLRLIASTILLGWSGMLYKGKPLNYTKANAIKVLKHREFRKMVMQHAVKMSNYLVKAEVADEKNS